MPRSFLKPCAACGTPSRGYRCPACAAVVAANREQRRGTSTQRGYGHEYMKARELVLRRDNRTCYWCGGPATTADHIVPLAHGGSSDPSNLTACCAACNSARGGRTRR